MSSGTSIKPNDSLEPWQFFVLAALLVSTGVILYNFFGTGGQAAARHPVHRAHGRGVWSASPRCGPCVRCLAGGGRTPMVGERTRVALEREKLLTLRSIKELEFDRAMASCPTPTGRRCRAACARAAGLMKQLDAGAGYREQIGERDLAKRLASPADLSDPRPRPFCTECGTKNEATRVL
jgi:hypothetical protein